MPEITRDRCITPSFSPSTYHHGKLMDGEDYYNNHRYHESIDNLTPADVYSGRGPTILAERERIKQQTIAERRLQHQLQA